MQPFDDNWDNFVAELRSDIMLHAPMRQREGEHTEAWEELVSRLRFEIEHPDKELLALLADKETEIGHLKSLVSGLSQKVERLQADSTCPMPVVPVADETSIYERQIGQAQQFVNENSKADVSRLRDLLRKIIPAEFHPAIDNIKEAKLLARFEINGGNNQILPNAEVGIQVLGER